MRRYLPVHESRGAVVVRGAVPGSLVGGLLVLVGWPVLPTMVLGVVALAGGAFVLDLASAHRRWRASLSPPAAEPSGVGTSSPR